jgi:hypothetical protein
MTRPRASHIDLILSKTFVVTERLHLQGRFEAFNATVGTNGVGQTTAAGRRATCSSI